MLNGRIIKGIGGFYYILTKDQKDFAESFLFRQITGAHGDEIVVEAKARGVLRHQKIKPVVGDRVKFSMDEEGAVIEEILPRKNAFVRPPVANVDLAVISFSVVEPKADLLLLDKLLITAECFATEPVIALTKTDLAGEKETEKIRRIYADAGYPVYLLSNDEGDDFQKLKEKLQGKTAFMAGPSGVGKSTLVNRFCEKLEMETGDLSKKLGRGKHTTRHVELLKVGKASFLLDTPGFSSYDLTTTLRAEDLSWTFREFPRGACRFNSCTHCHEPGCGVKQALEEGKIAPSRYEHYCLLYGQLAERTKNYRKK